MNDILKIFIGAFFMGVFMYAFIWAFSIACILMGHDQQICGI
jgi:hypothetical protein